MNSCAVLNVTVFCKKMLFSISKLSAEVISKECTTETLVLIGLVLLMRKGQDLANYCIFSITSICWFPLYSFFFFSPNLGKFRIFKNLDVNAFF